MKSIRKHILSIVLSVCLLFVTVFMYMYMYKAVGTSVMRAVEAKSAVRSQQSNATDSKNVGSIYNRTALDRARLRSYFVSSSDVVGFIEKLEDLGTQTGSTVSISNVAADDMSGLPQGALGAVQARVDITGQWSSIMRALMLSESLPYKSTVSSVHLGSSGGASSDKDPKTIWHVSYSITASMISMATSTR